MITVSEVGPQQSTIWNQFVNAHPDATVSHLFEWKPAIEGTYRLKAYYLGAFSDGTLVGILPTIIIKRPLTPPFAVSLAFCSYAGWLVRADQEESLLVRQFQQHLTQHGIHALESWRIAQSSTVKSHEVTMRLVLTSSPDELWKRFDPKVRNQVRKATKSGLEPRWGKDQLDEFYSIYSDNMRHLGTPVHSKGLFRSLQDHLPTFTDLLTIRLGDQAVAAMFILGFRDQLYDMWASSLREYDSICPNMLMYWEALRYGCVHGFTIFDMGRSQVESGTYRFKAQWGAVPHPLEYVALTVDGSSHSVSTDLYRSSTAAILGRIWKICPRTLTNWMGPKLRKYLP
jgi:FemAB-related protein (PEP-CTERM system-associated)